MVFALTLEFVVEESLATEVEDVVELEPVEAEDAAALR
jgi:hypothetical protein